MKPSERIDEIYEEAYQELTDNEKFLVDKTPIGELGLRYEVLLRYLDEDYKHTH